MNRALVFGIALFVAVVGIAAMGGESNVVVAGHGCHGCDGARCDGARCDGRVRCEGRVRCDGRERCCGRPERCCGRPERCCGRPERCSGADACDCRGGLLSRLRDRCCGAPVTCCGAAGGAAPADAGSGDAVPPAPANT